MPHAHTHTSTQWDSLGLALLPLRVNSKPHFAPDSNDCSHHHNQGQQRR